MFSIEAQGECLPRFDNYVELDTQKKDAWGIPVLRIHSSYGENERAMAKAMRRDIENVLDSLKVRNPSPPKGELSVFGKNIHAWALTRRRAC
jgi:hypothetical protein